MKGTYMIKELITYNRGLKNLITSNETDILY